MSDKKGNVSDKKGNIDMPALTERDLELLIGALRCIEGGFPKVSHIVQVSTLYLYLRSFDDLPILFPIYFEACHPFPRSLGAVWPQVCEHADFDGLDGVNCDRFTGHRDNIASDTLSKQPDMQKFATMAGFKTPASANVSFNLLKRKVMGDSASAKPTPKKAIPAKRKQAATESGNGDGDEPDESATKKPKMAPKKAAKKKAEPQPEGGDDEGTAFI